MVEIRELMKTSLIYFGFPKFKEPSSIDFKLFNQFKNKV